MDDLIDPKALNILSGGNGVGVEGVLVNFLSTTIWLGARVIDRERRMPL